MFDKLNVYALGLLRDKVVIGVGVAAAAGVDGHPQHLPILHLGDVRIGYELLSVGPLHQIRIGLAGLEVGDIFVHLVPDVPAGVGDIGHQGVLPDGLILDHEVRILRHHAVAVQGVHSNGVHIAEAQSHNAIPNAVIEVEVGDAHLLGEVVVRAPGQRRADPPRLPVLYVQFPFGSSAAAAGEHPPCRQQAEQPEYHSLSSAHTSSVSFSPAPRMITSQMPGAPPILSFSAPVNRHSL